MHSNNSSQDSSLLNRKHLITVVVMLFLAVSALFAHAQRADAREEPLAEIAFESRGDGAAPAGVRSALATIISDLDPPQTTALFAGIFFVLLGFRADTVANGLEVLDALRRQSYDLILMDVQMPDMDGMTATTHVRQEFPPEAQPRIIALTANAMQGDAEACLTPEWTRTCPSR